ncbi:MAG: hypothetical protein ABW212_05045 [Pseudonocardia sediminis]
MRPLRALLGALLLVTLLTVAAPPAGAVPGPGSLSGAVTVPPGYDVRDVRVTAHPVAGGAGGAAWTALDGSFAIPDLTPGEYRISFGTYERDMNVWAGSTAWWTSPGVVAGRWTGATFVDAGTVTVESGTDGSLGTSPLLTHLPVETVSGRLEAPPGRSPAGTRVELWLESGGVYGNRPGGWNRVPGIAPVVVDSGGTFAFDVSWSYWAASYYGLRVVDPSGEYAFSFANGGLDATTPGTSGDFGAGAVGLVRVPGELAGLALGVRRLKLPVAGSGTVSVSGSTAADPTRAEWGRTLTAVADVTWSEPTVTTGFQWYRNGVAVDEATGPTYDLDGFENGWEAEISVRAVPAGFWATSDVIASAPVTVVRSTPLNRRPPALAGTPLLGQRLVVSPGTWSPVLRDGPTTHAYTHTYQWFRGTTPVAGATGPSYVATASDFGSRLRVRVTADRPTTGSPTFLGPGVAWSAPSPAVRAPAELGLRVRLAPGHRRKKRPRTQVTVVGRVAGTPAPGLVRVLDGDRVLRTLRLRNGRAVLTVRLARGRHRISAVYVPGGLVLAGPPAVRPWRVRR